MGKKCIPGLFCVENMTLFLLVFAFVLIGYLYYVHFVKRLIEPGNNPNIIVLSNPPASNPPPRTNYVMRPPLASRLDNPYTPPVKNEDVYFPPDFGDVRGVPVNVRTRGTETSYQQVGILTRTSGEQILPLMGRRNMSGRDKWQYYTMSTTGNMNTKLPLSVNGKSCTGEYGCDDISNGDMVYVEGYNDTFRVTMYENDVFRYLPY